MIITLVILSFLTIFIIGLIQVLNRYSKVVKKIDSASEYRNQFLDFSNKYFEGHDKWSRSGNFDSEQYVWLTMNVSKMQSELGAFGVMSYISPYQTYKVSNYQIIINTIPKFRDGSITDFDTSAIDDCLLRYIGYLDEYSKSAQKNLKNPFIWFREGFKEILSIPITILNWFGIISNQTVISIKDSLIYTAISGIIALVSLVSGLITITVEYEKVLEFITSLIL
jgi:hypothetical protein